MSLSRLSLPAFLLAALTGCQSAPDLADVLDRTPAYAPVNYRGDARLPADLHRVAVLPVSAGALAEEESVQSLDEVVHDVLLVNQNVNI